MGGSNEQESNVDMLQEVASQTPNALVDAPSGGGPTLADGAPQRPVFDAAQTIADVRAASGVDQYIQPQIGGESKVDPGAVVGETVVVPGQQDPLVSAGDTMRREPVIGAAPDGGIATGSTPGDHIDEVVDPSKTITYEPIIGNGDNGNFATDMKVGIPGNEAPPVVPAAERKWRGRIPSGAKNTDASVTASVETPVVDPTQGVEAPVFGATGPASEGANADSPVVEPVTAANDAVVGEADASNGTEGEANPSIGVAVPPPGETYPGMQPPTPSVERDQNDDGSPPDNIGVAVPAPRELTPEQKQEREWAESDKREEDELAKKDWDLALSPDAGTPPADPNLAAALNSDANPNKQGRIEQSGVAGSTTILAPDAADELRADGTIKLDEEGTETIDATAAGGGSTDEVVPAVSGDPAPVVAPETQDVVVDDTPEDADPVAEGEPAAPEVAEEVADPAATLTSQETPAPAEAGDGDAQGATIDIEAPTDTAETTDASTQVVEDIIKPLEEIMSMNLSDEIDRLSKLDTNARSTEIKKLVRSGIRAKLKQEGKENFADAFDSMEDLEKKINSAQMVLEFMTATSEVVETSDDPASTPVAA